MNKWLKISALFVALRLLSACAETEPRSRAAEEEAIYSLLLAGYCVSYYDDSPVLVLTTTYSSYASYADVKIPIWREAFLDEEIIDDYRAANQQNQILDFTLPGVGKFCTFITKDELESTSKENDQWFNNHMLITFSGAGFNENLDQAFVYMEYNCGVECAGGDIYYLTRKGDVWTVKRVESTFHE